MTVRKIKIIDVTKFDISKYYEVQEGFEINELLQNDKVRMYDVR